MISVIQSNYSIIALFISVFIGLYFYLSRNFDYWSSRGIKGPKPLPLVGNVWNSVYKTIAQFDVENLEKYGNIFGEFLGSTPVLVVAEPQLIKDIMIKDFNKFLNRIEAKIDDPIIGRMLPFETNENWKRLRSVISPTFSTGKMKKMHNLVEECVQNLYKKLETVAKNEEEIELKKLMGDYTLDVIASCAFATKIDTHNDPNNAFVKNVSNAFANQIWRFFLLVGFNLLMRILDITVFPRNCIDFFTNAVREILRQRVGEKHGKHNDFLELMVMAQKKEDLESEDKLNDFESHHVIEQNFRSIDNKNNIRLTDNEVFANSFLFFVAGYETASVTLSHLIYQLAINTECQQKLFEEISECSQQNGGLDYESISRLPYLDACISEVLRVNTPVTQALRVASDNYTLGQTGITVPKGMTIIIPIHAIHTSSKYYPNPQQFDPNRFMPENRDKIIPYTYLPFGAGPRNCVGLRFALMEAKTAIARLIPRYKFFQTENTRIPLKYKKFDINLTPTEVKIGVGFRNSEK